MFFGCTPTCPFIAMPIFMEMKVLSWYICHASFTYIWLVIPKFLYFKSFLSSWKYHCRLLLGGFFGRNTPKYCQNNSKFWLVMQRGDASGMRPFFLFLENTWNWAKLFFWLFFRGFSIMPFYALCLMPQSSAKLKVLWWYIIMVSLISIAFVVPTL